MLNTFFSHALYIPQPARGAQVADALSGEDLQQWATVLGLRAAAADWSDRLTSGDMQRALHGLSSNARTAVLQAMFAVAGPAAALTHLPTSLHASVLGAMISTRGALTPPRDSGAAAEAFMHALPSLHLSAHPPVRSLVVTGAAAAESSTAQHLAAALRALPALTHLAFAPQHRAPLPSPGRTLCVAAAAAVLPAVRHATGLVSLEVCMDGADGMPASSLDCLIGALTSLTSLRALNVSSIQCCRVDKTPGMHVCNEPAGEDLAVGEKTLSQHESCEALLSTVASHPSLTALRLRTSTSSVPVSLTGSFPLLQELVVQLEVSLSSEAVQACEPQHQHQAPDLPLGPPAACPALTKLDFDIEVQDSTESSRGGGHRPPLRCIPGECPRLRSLSVRLRCPGPPTDRVTELWRGLAGAASYSSSLDSARCRTLAVIS